MSKEPNEHYKPSPVKFLRAIFETKSFDLGRSMKRSKSSVDRWSSERDLIEVAKARGMRLLLLNGEYILLDGSQDLLWLVPQSNAVNVTTPSST